MGMGVRGGRGPGGGWVGVKGVWGGRGEVA